jgi:hypothetical protein
MSEYLVSIEGQSIPIPEEIGADDESVRRSLAPFYPEVANAMITRVEKDGVTTITVVKRAGSKGAQGIDSLKACAGGKNPAIALYEEIRGTGMELLDPEQLLVLDERLEQAIEAGEAQARAVERARERLAETAPRPAPAVVLGF